jgi:hypothetical protein
MATETIHARGHENVTAKNRTTFEITKETHLTKRGDCIIAIDSSKGAIDLSQKLRKAAQSQNAKITIHIKANREFAIVNAWGHPQLTLTHPTDLVIRKSDYVCNRTLAIRADKAARDLPKTLVEKLKNPKQNVKITVTVEAAT